MSKKNKTSNLTTASAQQLHAQMAQMAQDGYVALPMREVFGNRVEKAGTHWADVYNALLGAGPDGQATPTAGAPIGTEMPVAGGTKELGYIAWGGNNRFPNQMALLASMLPYTAVGVKFNADVIAGLGPKPKYRYNRYVNGSLQTEKIDYAAAGELIRGQLADKRRTLLDFFASRNPNPATEIERELQDQLELQLRDEVAQAEEELKLWERTNKEVEEFMKNTNHNLQFASMSNDMSLVGICFPEVQLDKQAANKNDATWSPKILGLNFHSCCKCRLERKDQSGRINYVYVSNQWMDRSVVSGEDTKIAAVPALDPHRPLQSLQEKVRNHRIRSYTGGTTANGKAKTASRFCGVAIGYQCIRNTCRHAQHISQRIDNDLIKCKDHGNLNEDRQATAHGVEALLLVHLLDLLRHLLLRCLVSTSLILFADRHFLGAQSCLLNGIFLLFDTKGQHHDLNHKSKDQNAHHVVTARDLRDDLQELADPHKQGIDGAVVGFKRHGLARTGDDLLNLLGGEVVAKLLKLNDRGIVLGLYKLKRGSGTVKINHAKIGCLGVFVKALGTHVVATGGGHKLFTRLGTHRQNARKIGDGIGIGGGPRGLDLALVVAGTRGQREHTAD